MNHKSALLGAVTQLRKPAWTALLAMSSVYFFSYFLRSAVPGTIFDEIQTEFSLSASAVAGLGSVFLAIYASTQLVAGMAADRYGGRRVLLWGAIVMAIGALWFPVAHSPFELYAARALTGFGSSFMYLSIVQEIACLFEHRRFPTVLGGVLFVGYIGNIAGTLPFAWIVRLTNWRSALLGIGVLILLSLWGAWAVLRKLPRHHVNHAPLSFAPLWQVFRNPVNRPLIVASLTNFSVYFVIQTVVGKKFIQDVAGLRPEPAATFTLVMAIVSASITCLSGFWLKLSGHRRKPVLLAFVSFLVAGALLLAAGVAFQAPAFVYLTAFILLAASVPSGAVSSTIVKELNPPEYVGQSVAVINAMAYVGVAVLSWLVGVVLDRYVAASHVTAGGRVYPPAAYLELFELLSVVALVSALAMMRIPETHPKAQPIAPKPEEPETLPGGLVP